MAEKLSARIREAAAGYGTEAEPDAALLALSAEGTDLEKRAVPEGWTPVTLDYEDGTEVWLQSDGWHWQPDEGLSYPRALPGIPPTEWRAAIAAAEAAKAGKAE